MHLQYNDGILIIMGLNNGYISNNDQTDLAWENNADGELETLLQRVVALIFSNSFFLPQSCPFVTLFPQLMSHLYLSLGKEKNLVTLPLQCKKEQEEDKEEEEEEQRMSRKHRLLKAWEVCLSLRQFHSLIKLVCFYSYLIFHFSSFIILLDVLFLC